MNWRTAPTLRNAPNAERFVGAWGRVCRCGRCSSVLRFAMMRVFRIGLNGPGFGRNRFDSDESRRETQTARAKVPRETQGPRAKRAKLPRQTGGCPGGELDGSETTAAPVRTRGDSTRPKPRRHDDCIPDMSVVGSSRGCYQCRCVLGGPSPNPIRTLEGGRGSGTCIRKQMSRSSDGVA